MDVAQALSIDNDVTVISPKPTRPLDFKFDDKQKNYPFEHVVAESFTYPESKIYGRMKESYSFGKWCENYIRKNHENIDVIYMNSWPMFSQMFISRAAEKYKIPLITHIMDIYPESIVNKLPVLKSFFYKVLLPMDKNILHRSKKVLTISENMKVQLQKSRDLPENKFEIITTWQNEENFVKYHESKEKTNNQRDNLFTFMYMGNNGPVAGVEFLIECFVKADIPNTKLIIAGSGSKTDDCKNLAKKLNAENVEFMTVSEGRVPFTQDLADVMLLPVKKNGAFSSIPSKLPAYMFSAKPIIGSLDLESDTARAIKDADAGMVVEPEHEEKLINAMKEIADWSTEKLTAKGKNGFNYSMEHFSKRGNLRKITDIILNL
ncbi:glycosyltransferase family 4 protein [Chryseobacterium koreense]|uniref:glycosyltransferase family 4 protein n=1 Tax=Chryseobacterium koreense TaxID=232216 RepID=UPI0026EEF8D0|nr:glycosyltransferase family 4 protein [Chryseobacterium koreense]